MIKNKLHLKILKSFKKLRSNSDLKERQWVQHYLGSNKPTESIKTEIMKKFVKTFAKENDLSFDDFIDLLNSLYKNATTFDEITIAGRLIKTLPKLGQQIDPKSLDEWLNYTNGWAEIDMLCQSNFESDQLLLNWSQWQKTLKEFNKSSKIAKRRASIVLLVKSLSQSDDQRLSTLLFKNIDNLKQEKEILITKAISWGLRSLVKHHPGELKSYLEKNKELLPKIAYREALTKLTTGRKYNKKVKN